jgi:uncharacterized protein (TIGR02145 family)
MKMKNITLIFGLISFSLVIVISCRKEDNRNKNISIPTLSTTIIDNIMLSSATSGGKLIFNGGDSIISYGICWNTEPAPTLTDFTTIDTGGSGNFSSVMTGLMPNSKYFVRAYATNNIGTGYGNILQFTTLPESGSIVKDIEGNAYHTVTIGTQIWLKENLKTTVFLNGDSIIKLKDNASWGKTTSSAYCEYDNTFANSEIYGMLYNWYAVNDSRNIAPNGWHVSSDEDWNKLIKYLGTDDFLGGKLQEAGTSHWPSPNSFATNESGFTALPGGARDLDGTFGGIGLWGFWWTSTQFGLFPAATYWNINPEGYLVREALENQAGFSVRCVKD